MHSIFDASRFDYIAILCSGQIHQNQLIVCNDFCAGRVLLFTSGHENAHFVERVTWGVRYAITISFTCEQKEAIADPLSLAS